MNCVIFMKMRMRGPCTYALYEYCFSVYLACAVQEYYTVHKYYKSIIMTNSVSKQYMLFAMAV